MRTSTAIHYSLFAVTLAVAGCVGDRETAPVAADTAAKPVAAEKAKPEGFKPEWTAARNGVNGLNMHSTAMKVEEMRANAEAFLAKYAATTNKSEVSDMNDLRDRLLGIYIRQRDPKGGLKHCDVLDKCGNFGWEADAASYRARSMLDAGAKLEEATALFEKFYARKDVNWIHWEKFVGLASMLYVHRGDMKGGLAYVEKARTRIDAKWNEDCRARFNAGLDNNAIAVFEAFYRYRDAFDYLMKRGNESKAFSFFMTGKLGAGKEWEEGVTLAKKLVNEKANQSAWAYLWRRDPAFCEATVDKLIGEKREKARVNSVATELRQMIANANINNVYGAPTPAYFNDHELTARLYALYAKLLAEVGGVTDYRVARQAANAFSALGKRDEAVKVLELGLGNDKLKPEEKYELKLMAKIVSAKGSVDAIADAVKAAEAELAKECPAKLREKYFGRAAAIATVSGDETLMRGVAKFFKDVIKPELPKKSYVVKFSDRRIAGAGDWANLPFKPEESDFDRQYGGAGMAFMTTDVATGDRGDAVKGGEKTRKFPTTLQVVADEWGVHLLFSFYDKRARQFESGELDCGSYECYIAAGANEPYTCFLCRPKTDDRVDGMHTAYNAPGHRRVVWNDPSSVKSEAYFTDDCVMCYNAFSWDNFAEHVPVKGGEWDFEAIFWGPIQSAWNGTASIHGRSTWGKLKFDLDEAARVKILRAQLFKAVNEYRAEKNPKGSKASGMQEGCFDHWADDAVGDPEFYEAKLVPLMKEIDAGVDCVKVGMSDADVKRVAETWLVKLRSIRYVVARLRNEWMLEKLSK